MKMHEPPTSLALKKLSALSVDTQPERCGLFECADSPREAVFIGMCASLPCQKKTTKVTQARLELATIGLQVVRLPFRHPAAKVSH